MLRLPKPLLPPTQSPTSTPENPCCCASCAVVAKGEWTATPATADREGKGNRSLRRSNTRKGAESILDNRLVGQETNALLAKGPHCDLIMPSRGLATLAKRHSSNGVAQLTKRPAVANPCVADTDPLLLPHGVRPSARCPRRAIETCPLQDLSALRNDLDRPHLKTSLQCTDDDFSN